MKRELVEQNDSGDIQLWSFRIDGKTEYEIVYNGVFIMATYNRYSSEKLVEYAVDVLKPLKKELRVLIGGLGMGLSLNKALEYDCVTVVDVVEIEPVIIQWYDKYFYEEHGGNYNIICEDLVDYVKDTDKKYDAVCIDIDNGPDWLLREENKTMYTKDTLIRITEMINGQGVLTIWSHNYNNQFELLMGNVFTQADTLKVYEKNINGKYFDYYIYRGRIN